MTRIDNDKRSRELNKHLSKILRHLPIGTGVVHVNANGFNHAEGLTLAIERDNDNAKVRVWKIVPLGITEAAFERLVEEMLGRAELGLAATGFRSESP